MPSLRHNSAMLSSPRRPAITMRIFSSAEYCRRVARRISRTRFSASAESVSTFDLIARSFAVKMSSKSSLPQSLTSVQLVLTGNTPHKPAKQEVVIELLHQKPLAAHRVQHLQQQRAQQLLRRNRRPPAAGGDRVEAPRRLLKRRIHHYSHGSQRKILGYSPLRRYVA